MRKKLVALLFLPFLVVFTPSTSQAVPTPLDCSGVPGIVNYIVKCVQVNVLNVAGWHLDTTTNIITPTANPNNPIVILTNAIRQSVRVICAIAVMFFGIKMSLGGLKGVTGESMGMLLRLALVIALTSFDGVQFVYPMFFYMSLWLSDLFGSVSLAGPCASIPNGELWMKMDCLFKAMVGISNPAANMSQSIGTGKILLFIAVGSLLFASGFGFFIVGILGFSVIFILGTAATVMFSYLLCFIAVTFLVAFMPVVAPTILFKSTRKMISKWFDLLLSYTMQPIIIIAFVSLMITVFSYAVFGIPPSGTTPHPDSLFAMMRELDPTRTPSNITWLFFPFPLPTPNLAWMNDRFPLFMVNCFALAVTIWLMYSYMLNVSKFANELAGVGASTSNLADKMNFVAMAHRLGTAKAKMGASAIKGAIKGAKGGPKGMIAGAAKAAGASAARSAFKEFGKQ